MSTIVLQHIAVYDIRFQYLREFFRIMKPGGLLSFQMGFGEGYGKAGYYDNHYHAESTNSAHDTLVTSPEQIQGDLEQIGFVDFEYAIRPSFDDGHPYWIFAKANKPSVASAFGDCGRRSPHRRQSAQSFELDEAASRRPDRGRRV